MEVSNSPLSVKSEDARKAVASKPKLLDEVRQAIRARHYSKRTEKTYVDWIKRFIFFHGKRHPMEMGEPEINQFLTELALNQMLSWGEGILMMPANRKNRDLLELLLRYGARVPDISKWGRAYYFKHYEIALFLLRNGMNPNHMSWQHVTLLHDMAQEGDIAKAGLLLDHGADINPTDEEYRSTPLGLAARWGQREMVGFLLGRGADPNKAGAPWATPLAWAKRKGHDEIAADLTRTGAVTDGKPV